MEQILARWLTNLCYIDSLRMAPRCRDMQDLMYAINGVSRSAFFGRYIDCYVVITLVGRRKMTVNPTSE
jgi:hypothetical protein